MKQIIKKLFKYSLLCLLLMVVFFSNYVKTEAAWSGSSSLDTYKQVEEEMRAVWVATVSNLNIDPQPGKGENAINQWKGYYLDILDNAEANNLNAIIFQIRPENDAFYPSKYNPWSRYLMADGTDPGWDPLKWMIEVTHARGMEYHAWLNPYRASNGTLRISLTEKDPITGIEKIIDVDQKELNEYKEVYFSGLREKNPDIDNPVLKTGEELYYNVVLGSEAKFILNPASETVRSHINNTISEIVDNYDIDGIHFDDYFYPNDAGYNGSNANYKGKTYSSEPYYDQQDYNNYLLECSNNNIESMNVYDWRRENVNKLISGLGDIIRTKNAEKEVKCAFGISPAARWAPTVEVCSSEPYRGAEGGMSGSCNNYYSYSDLYADTYKWAKEGWIDYIVPQNYTNLAGDYSDIIKWWSNALKGYPVKLYVGTALYQVSSSWGDSGGLEILNQLRYNQTYDLRVDGYFIYSYNSLLTTNGKNAMKPVVQIAWKYPTLTPLYNEYEYNKTVTENSHVQRMSLDDENNVSITYTKVEGAKAYGVYKALKGETPEFIISNIVTRTINPDKNLQFKYDENYDYYLVTYDSDNTVYNQYELIDLENEDPTVNVSFDKESYYGGEAVKISVDITDVDDEIHDVLIMYGNDAQSLLHKVYDDTVTNNKTIEFILPTTDLTEGVFSITVKDQLNTIIVNESINISHHAPSAEVLFDKEQYSCNDTLNFTLNITDLDSETVDLTVLYSQDGLNYSETILPLIEDITKDPLTLSYSLSGATSESKVKVIISDGINTTEEIISLVIVNAAPIISINNISNSKVGSQISVPFTVSDSEGDNLTYKVYISYDNSSYNEVASGSVSNNFVLVNVNAENGSNNATVKVEVFDGTNTTSAISNVFQIEGSAKKGCGCGKDFAMFEIIATVALLAFVLRKKER